jgi:hypothetical protein
MRPATAFRHLLEFFAPRRIEDPAFESLWFDRRRGHWSKKDLIGSEAPIVLVYACERGPSERQRVLRVELERRLPTLSPAVDAALRNGYTRAYGEGRPQPADIRAIAKLRYVEFRRDGDDHEADLHLLYELMGDETGHMLSVLLKDWEVSDIRPAR